MANESTTKFKVDISQLKKGIQDANRQIRLANAEFKAAAAGMDDWEKSANGLTAKIQQQDKVLKAQNTILKDYEKQLELIEKEYGANSKEADEMRIKIANQQAAVSKTEKALAGYKAQLDGLGKETNDATKDTGKLSNAVSELDTESKSAAKSSKTLGEVLKSGLAAGAKVAGAAIKAAAASIGAAAVAAVKFGKDSVSAGMDFDSSMSQVAATMGKSVDEIQNLRDFAMEMGSKTAFSATQAADALNYMALAGYDAETSMKMLPNVLNLAAAGGIELAAASDMVTDAQSALGLSLDDTSALVDKMAKAASKSNTSVSQLGDAILTIGGTAKGMAGGTTELASALGILADNGIKGAEGGTALRNILLTLSAPTDKAAEAMEAIGLKAYDAQGNLRPLESIFADLNRALGTMTEGEKTNVLNDIFNKVDLKSANALLATNADRWEELAGSIGDATGAAEAMANTQLDNLAGDITLFNSALEGAKITVSDALTPSLREFVQLGTDGVSRLAEAFKQNGLEGAIAELSPIFGKILEKITGLLPAVIKVATELITAIAEQLPPILQSILPPLIQGVSQVLHALVQQMPALMQIISDSLPILLDALLTILPEVVDVGLQMIGQLAIGIAKALPTLIPKIIDIVMQISETLIDNIDILVDGAMQLILGLTKGIIDALPLLMDKAPVILEKFIDALLMNWPIILDAALQLVDMLVKGIKENLPKMIDAAIRICLELANGIIEALPIVLDGVMQLMIGIANAMIEALPVLIGIMPEIIEKLVDALIENAPAILDATVKMVEMLTQTIIENIPLLLNAAKQIIIAIGTGLLKNAGTMKASVKKLLDKIGGIIGNSLGKVADWGKGIAESIGNGISSMMTSVQEKIKAIFAPIVNWLKTKVIEPVMKIAQPVFEIIGQLAEGTVNTIKAVWGAVSGWFDSTIIKPVSNFFGDLWDAIGTKAEAVWTKIKAVWNVVARWFQTYITQPVSDFFGGMWDSLKKGASDAWEGIKKVFGVVSDWFKNTFSDAWQKVKDVFSTGGKVFDGIKEGITNAFKTVVNAIIRGINKIVAIPFNAINTMLDTLQNAEIAGVRPFANMFTRLPVPVIPELAKGGVLKKGQVGLLEGNGAEAVVPLENNRQWIAATAEQLKRDLIADGILGAGGAAQPTVNNYNFVQNNTSPKALSRLDIYRQSKNLLSMAGGA